MANKKVVIITDVDGGKLRLTKTRLVEAKDDMPYHLNLRTLARALKAGKGKSVVSVRIQMRNWPPISTQVVLPGNYSPGKLHLSTGKIGCRELYPDDFNKIVRAAKALVRKSRKTQTVAKAKGAAAGKAKRK